MKTLGKSKITDYIINYLQENGMESHRVSLDTGVSETKLRPDACEALNATEFLVLCEYLQISPEEIKAQG